VKISKIIIGIVALLLVQDAQAVLLRSGNATDKSTTKQSVSDNKFYESIEKLLVAAQDESNVESILDSLSQKIDLSMKGLSSKTTFLHLVAQWENYEKIYAVVEKLKEIYPESTIYKFLFTTNNEGQYPLELAAKNDVVPAIKAFLLMISESTRKHLLLENKNVWLNAVIYGHVGNITSLLLTVKSLGMLDEYLLNRCFWSKTALFEYAVRYDRVDVVAEIYSVINNRTKKALLSKRNSKRQFPCEYATSDEMLELLKP
jgi:hypothetical protein